MKVALIHDYLREYGGAERVLEAIHELFPDADVYTSYYFPEKMPESMKSWKIFTSPLRNLPFLKSHFMWYTYLVPWSFEQFDLRKYDLVISSSSFAAKGVLTYPGQVHVCYCHTPTRFLWGINGKSNRRKLIRPILDFINTFLRKWDFAAAQRVDYFIANSEVVKKRIKEFYNKDSVVINPFSVLPEATIKGSSEYYLTLSRLEHLKKVDVIIEAFNQLNLPLKVGGTGVLEDSLKKRVAPNVEMLGFVPEDELADLYKNAKAFVVCGEDEDFGMTVTEALTFGVPVIALRRGGYMETVVENESGVFFEQATVEDLIAAVRKFEGKNFDHDKIQECSKRFSRESFKVKFKEFVDSVSA
jgi:glycosyltransferase involved in cell wall biosynthesis